MKTKRKSEYPISNFILNRWSPRAMSGEEITNEELMSLFEAARWAPSASNIQPWRFIYVKRDTPEFEKFFDLLVDFNKIWCKNASALICLIAKKKDDKEKENYNYMSDCGAAWENLALQASVSGLVCHGIGGFDKGKARSSMKVPEDYSIVHMIAIGKPADASVLPERMQKSEVPSERKPLKELIFKGEFK